MAQRRQNLDIKDNFGIKLMVITFNFSNINNPPNKALLVLLKAQSFDCYMSVFVKPEKNRFFLKNGKTVNFHNSTSRKLGNFLGLG